MRGVTLDLWDTIIIDDSDEPARAARGLPTKRRARLAAMAEAIATTGAERAASDLAAAWDAVHEEFVVGWRRDHVTFGVAERVARVLARLDVAPAADAIRRAITAIEEVECDPPPVLIDGAAAGVRRLAARGPVVLVSDTVVTPGRGLRRILDRHGLLDAFAGFVFSDEAGRSKPHRSVFERAATIAGSPLDALTHVGDRQGHDVVGAQDAGLKAVLFTASRDVDLPDTTADATCASWDDLPDVIERLWQDRDAPDSA